MIYHTRCFQSTAGILRFVSIACYLTLMTFQLLCYCWTGNDVIMHSGTLSDTIFESDWIAIDEQNKKLLLLMMMRAQRPTQFTAAGFAILSYPTFMSVSFPYTKYNNVFFSRLFSFWLRKCRLNCRLIFGVFP